MGSMSSSKSKTELPEWYSDYAKKNLALGEAVSQQGYTPWMGADVAAFTPQQVEGMQEAQDWSSAFMTPGQAAPRVADQIPQAQEFAGGVQGYSSYPMYQEQLANLAKSFPGLSDYIKQFSIDPKTGQVPTGGIWDKLKGMPSGDRAPVAPKPRTPWDADSMGRGR